MRKLRYKVQYFVPVHTASSQGFPGYGPRQSGARTYTPDHSPMTVISWRGHQSPKKMGHDFLERSMQNSCVLIWKRSWKVRNMNTALRNFWVSTLSCWCEPAGHSGWGSHSAVPLGSPFKRTSLEQGLWGTASSCYILRSSQALTLRPCSPRAVHSQ